MSMTILSKDDLKDLTGASQRSRQMQFLIKNKINFFNDVNGNIKTTVEAVNAALIGVASNSLAIPEDDGFRLPRKG